MIWKPTWVKVNKLTQERARDGTITTYRLIKQFILSDALDAIPPEWAILHHNRWWMATHKDDGIPIIPVYSDGSQIGWLIGHGIDTNHKIIAQKFILPGLTTAGCIEDVENHLYQLTGAFGQ